MITKFELKIVFDHEGDVESIELNEEDVYQRLSMKEMMHIHSVIEDLRISAEREYSE